MDTGNLTDSTASENGAGPNTCGDGIDNSPGGADGLADVNDPDCLVGAVAFSSLAGGLGLGKGNSFAVGRIPNLSTDTDDNSDSDFEEAKFDPACGAFDPNRLLALRYAISGQPAGSSPATGFPGGQAHGNDFILFNRSAGLLMHELGHTLGLGHGGSDTVNCKPNYISVMNYRYQGGIQVAGGAGIGQDIDGIGDGRILDYSPPRFPSGRGIASLNPVNETSWDESVVLDASDSSNFYAWTTVDRQLVTARLDANPDWNNDGNTNNQAPPPIDFNTSFWNPAASEGTGTCNDGIDNDSVNGMDANDPVCNGNPRCATTINASNTVHNGAWLEQYRIQYTPLRGYRLGRHSHLV